MAGELGEAEAVFWDIGGVILDVGSVREAHRRFVEGLVADRGLDLDPEPAVATWRRAVGDYFRGREGTAFRPARRAYAVGVEALVGEPLAREEWWPRFRAAVDATARPMPHAPAVIGRLAGAGRHQGVVSDIDADEGRRLLERFGVRRHFDAVTTSEDVGRTKPDAAIFGAALEAAGVPADRAVMIGDRYDHDMAGAARQGIATVAFGADDGPAVDHRIDDLRELLDLLGVDRNR